MTDRPMTHDHDDPTPEPGGEAYVLAMIQVLVPNEAADPDRPIDTVDAVRAVIGPKPNIFDVGYGAWGQLLSESSQARLDPAPTPRGERPTVEEIMDLVQQYAESTMHYMDEMRSKRHRVAVAFDKAAGMNDCHDEIARQLTRLAAPAGLSVPEDVFEARTYLSGSKGVWVTSSASNSVYGSGPDWESALAAARTARAAGGG